MTSTALDLNHAAATLAIQPGQISWDGTQLAALDQLGLKDAGDGDRAVFLHVCQRTGLDPFARQIYMIPRNEKVPGTSQWRKKWTIQTGIDGFRVNRDRAERNAGVRGILGRALFYDPDGNEHKVWVQRQAPVACEITYTVRDRDGGETPYTSVLRFAEYCQADNDGNLIAQWKTKPAHMLEKCTEADVYRKAFPQDFSGMYLDDTMPPDTPPADGAPGGRPRGRVTVAEVIERTEAPAAGDDTHAGPGRAVAGNEARPGNGKRTRTDPRAAGAASPRGAQPPPPQGQPASDEVAKEDTPAEDQHGSASDDQLTSLHIVFGGLGFGSSEDDKRRKLKIAETITGRDLGGTSKNLSYTEARKLTHTLEGFGGDREKLIEYMAGREQAGDSDE